jgi:hypothetical protein
MIPRGLVYRELRTLMLEHYPLGTNQPFGRAHTIGEWLSKGSVTVTTSTRARVTFEAPMIEFGSILLTETENLLNHCFEHLQELGCSEVDKRLRSDAWITVTTYYLAFFSGSTLLRLLGQPIVFLTREQLTQLCKISGGATPTQGSYAIRQVRGVSVTKSEFELVPTSKIHEATWISLLGMLDTLCRRLRPNPDAKEVLFYDALCTRVLFSQYVNYQWPSSVRVRANYRPGFAYRLSSGRSPCCRALGELAKESSHPDVLRLLSDATLSCRSDPENFSNHVRLMALVGFSLFALARELYSELLIRKNIDKRWEQGRRIYRAKMIFGPGECPILTRTF